MRGTHRAADGMVGRCLQGRRTRPGVLRYLRGNHPENRRVTTSWTRLARDPHVSVGTDTTGRRSKFQGHVPATGVQQPPPGTTSIRCVNKGFRPVVRATKISCSTESWAPSGWFPTTASRVEAFETTSYRKPRPGEGVHRRGLRLEPERSPFTGLSGRHLFTRTRGKPAADDPCPPGGTDSSTPTSPRLRVPRAGPGAARPGLHALATSRT